MGAYTARATRACARDIEALLARSRCWPASGGRPAGTLSGGQQQILEMAIALLLHPRLLLLDEPSLGLDPRMVEIGVRDDRAINRAGTDRAHGRAERQAGAGGLAPRLRARARPQPLRGHRPGAAGESRRPRPLPGRLKISAPTPCLSERWTRHRSRHATGSQRQRPSGSGDAAGAGRDRGQERGPRRGPPPRRRGG